MTGVAAGVVPDATAAASLKAPLISVNNPSKETDMQSTLTSPGDKQTARSDESAEQFGVDRPELLRSLNTLLAGDKAAGPDISEVPFFCECESEACYAPVWLTVAEFADAVEAGLPIVHPDHAGGVTERL
jgi:hypothetical protein